MSDSSVYIVGAGIVGLASAAVLLERGYKVTVIDRAEPGNATSRGNAAAIAWTDVSPLASPGIWKKVPGWLFDPLGPLSIRPVYALKILPWMLRFAAASRPAAMRRSTEAIVALNSLALPAWERIWTRMGWGNHLRREGCLDVFDKESELAGARAGWRKQRDYGIEIEEIDGKAIRDMEPALSENVVGGAFLPGWLHVDDPLLLCRDLESHIRGLGGKFVVGQVERVERAEAGAMVHLADGATIPARKLVIAGGAWSKALAKGLGDAIPLDTERGYNITVPDPGVSLRRFVMLPGYGFVLSPIEPGLRIGGAVEFGGLEAEANWARVDALVARARKVVPDLKTDGGTRWMGFRPSIPDSLPVISKARGSNDILYAFGHGHHGLTQAAATAEIIADEISGAEPAIDISPYRVDRF
ncbi:FAD-dependent oxidoreductase [Stappia sp. F7233]|uniref:FAD-dependent oxidoreductase n=1 Tax=Stappia albiluteola TaxID=2758565 RepID=A0A839ADV6_9HYPH|nr:FAD-dependent oxidoreductase [Stappia albiluteola]MBA5777218.1 FAD-dependent oxidoreductase [Stappia albiluteola]